MENFSPGEQLKKSLYNVSYIKINIETSFHRIMDFHFRIMTSCFFKTILVSAHLVDLHVKCSLFCPILTKLGGVNKFYYNSPGSEE
jgi:hypothetical protein